jgi:hypothetical protein
LTEWDYKIIELEKFNSEDLAAKLKKAGINGWELIQIISFPRGSLDVAILKKPYEKRSF